MTSYRIWYSHKCDGTPFEGDYTVEDLSPAYLNYLYTRLEALNRMGHLALGYPACLTSKGGQQCKAQFFIKEVSHS